MKRKIKIFFAISYLFCGTLSFGQSKKKLSALYNVKARQEILAKKLQLGGLCGSLGQQITKDFLLGLASFTITFLLLSIYLAYERRQVLKKLRHLSTEEKTVFQHLFNRREEVFLELKKRTFNLDKPLLNQHLNHDQHQIIITKLIDFLEKIVENTQLIQLKLELDQFAQSIEKSQNQGKHWKKIALQIEKTHPLFFTNLLKQNPTLKKRDLQLCVYIRLGINNKEIAKLLGIEDASIYKARHRLKKKLSLEKNLDLNQFLLNL